LVKKPIISSKAKIDQTDKAKREIKNKNGEQESERLEIKIYFKNKNQDKAEQGKKEEKQGKAGNPRIKAFLLRPYFA
jgi:hypothetical protein